MVGLYTEKRMNVVDPLAFKERFWPDVYFYDKQREVIYSSVENDETYVPAGNMLGKDFVGGFILLYYFMTRHPCRIITTSAKEDHLRVLWGEVGRYIQTAAHPLDSKQGGPLICNYQELKKVVNGKICPLSYVRGLVASADSIAAMQGHHIAKTGDGIPRTMFFSDESSSVNDEYYKKAITWANRVVAIGNPWPCNNFFKHAVKGRPGTDDRGGDVVRKRGGGFYRKIIRIKATDSPNVRYGLAQLRRGIEPNDEVLVPGVKSYSEYEKNLQMWDKIQQCVSLDGDFYEGAEVMLFPKDWLDYSEMLARDLRGKPRKAKAIGIDPAEGGDKTSMTAVDDLGVIECVSKKTPDTSIITGEAIAFGRKHGVEPFNWIFDRGGGGKEHADRLRAQGFPVRTVGFGETLTLDPKRGLTMIETRLRMKEESYSYRNRRAEMYGDLRWLMDPTNGGFAIPTEYTAFRQQLSPIPLTYDGEGRLELLPKNKRELDENTKKKTLIDLIGHSPDEADSLVLAVFGMTHKPAVSRAGVG